MTSKFTFAFLNDFVSPWKSQVLGRHNAKNLIRLVKALQPVGLFAIGLLVVGCGASNTQTSPSQIAITPTVATLAPGQTQQFTVTSGNSSAENLVWAINGIQGGNANVGTVSTDGLYVAPTGSEIPTSVTVSVTSASASSAQAQSTVTFRHDSLTLSPPQATVATGATFQFTASVPGQAGTTLEWKVNGVTGGNSALGTISAGGLYSAPTCTPSPAALTIQVTSSSDPLATAQSQLSVTSAMTLSPAQSSVPISQTLQFALMSTGPSAPAMQWSVNGVVGGNSQVGFVSTGGTFTAPALIPAQPILVAVTDATQGCSVANASVQVYDPAVNEAHDKWLDGVADAAASYGCTDVSIQQQTSETVESALTRFANTAEEGSCLVLSPISNETGLLRYSLDWGGTASGKDILYITDVDQVRIWNGTVVD